LFQEPSGFSFVTLSPKAAVASLAAYISAGPAPVAQVPEAFGAAFKTVGITNALSINNEIAHNANVFLKN
jgi:hypothetical protein